MTTLGDRIRQARKEKKLSQRDLGVMTGITQTNISLYENECKEPSLFTFLLIADALGVSADWLLGRKGARK